MTTRTSFFEAYAVGLVYASACTNMTDEDATREMNTTNPTGVTSTWEISTDATFANGSPHPNQCELRDDCRHVLFVC